MSHFAALGPWLDTFGARRRLRRIGRGPAFSSRSGIGRLDLGAAVIRFRTEGQGAHTIVLAADPPVVIEHYDELVGFLEDDFRVVVLELPGFGFSLPMPGLTFDFTATNDLIAAGLKRLQLGPYVLAFPCVSAYCAIDIAARFPDLVTGVVAMQAPSWPQEVKWKHGRDPGGLLSKPVIGQLALRALRRKVPRKWFGAAIGRRELLPGFVETADAAMADGACFCLASVFQRYLTDEAPVLGPVRQPAMVIWGEADRSHRHTDKASTLTLLPGAREERFGRAGHFPELEEPELFAALVREWVDREVGQPPTRFEHQT
jgi:pimeloyl-ACP methyl ester carboxylesterase